MREWLKTFCQFLGVMLCSLPAAIAYYALVRFHFPLGPADVCGLLVGFTAAFCVWQLIGKRFDSISLAHSQKNVATPHVNAVFLAPNINARWRLAGAVIIVGVVSVPTAPTAFFLLEKTVGETLPCIGGNELVTTFHVNA